MINTFAATKLMRSRWMISAVIMLVVAVLSLNWYYYQRTRGSLDENLGSNLKMLASLVSSRLDVIEDSFTAYETSTIEIPDTISEWLEALSSKHHLSNILVVREDGVVLLSMQPEFYPAGDIYSNWTMDYKSIIRSLEGVPSATKLFKTPGGEYLKAGYAPLPIYSGRPSAVVAVEASAVFLEEIGSLRTILAASTVVSILGTLVFIWLMIKAADSLIRARESLLRNETLSSMGRMAAGIAHEIRNPLFIIRGAAEKLRKLHPDDSSEIDEFIIDEVDRLNSTVTDYLLFARNEPANRRDIDLVEALDRSIRLLRETIEGEGIELDVRFEPNRAVVFGETKRLQQAFINILLNARQSMSNGGRILVTLSESGGDYIVRFRDEGTGIPEKEIDKVFEPFHTTKATGSGLGLAIARSAVENHGGSISIESRINAGTTITITLPANRAPEVEPDE